MGGEGSGNFGHAGRLGEVGGSSTEGSSLSSDHVKQIKENSKDFAQRDYNKADYEHMIAYKNGNYTYESKTHDRASCQIAEDIDDMDLVHNHPGGSPALSAPDIFVSAYQNVSSITAMNRKGEAWTVSRPKEGWAKWADDKFGMKVDTSEFQKTVRSQFDKTSDEVFDLPEMQPLHLAFTRGEIDLNGVEVIFANKTSETFCKKYGLTVTKHGGAK
jgi:hypothetical protein